MNQPEENPRLLDVCEEIDKASSPNNTTFHSFNVSTKYLCNCIEINISTYLK